MSMAPRARPAEAAFATAELAVTRAGVAEAVVPLEAEVTDAPAAVLAGFVALARVVLFLYGLETGAAMEVLFE